MWTDIRNQPRSVVYSILVHLAVVGFMVLGLSWQSTPDVKPNIDIVQATVVDEKSVRAEIDKLKKTDQKKKKAEQARLNKLKKTRKKEEQRLAKLRKKQAAAKKAEKARSDKLKKERAALERKNKARSDKLKKEQATLERKNKEERKRLTALEAKRKEEEKKRRTEEARLADAQSQRKIVEQKRIQEEQRLAELEKKHQQDQEIKERRKQEAEIRKKALEEEQKRLDAERAIQARSTINKYEGIIKQVVSRNWIQPPGVPLGLSCVVRVNLIPGGDVISARVITSSGNAIFDRSAETAVRKASPLPVPSDPYILDQFRNFTFTFKPEG